MAATHAAFEHFVQTGEIDLVLPSKETSMPKLTPYFTYEVGTDEPPHPDMDIAARFVEVAMSDCKYGCKVYADPYSEVRALVHSAVYGCRKTMAVLEEERKDGKIRPGDSVEFDPYDSDTGFTLTGKVLNYLEPDDAGFQGGFRIGCYYIVPEEAVRASSPGETYQQGYERLMQEGRTVVQIASYFGMSVEALKAMNLKQPDEGIYEGTEFKPGDMVQFKDPETEEVHLGQIMTYISPHFEPDDLPEETLGGYRVRTDRRHPVSGDVVDMIFYGKGSLTLAE
jgi:hypothetical protein